VLESLRRQPSSIISPSRTLGAPINSGISARIRTIRTTGWGTDQFRYQRTNQDNPNDRLNGEILITVTVK
jgi:hypothetical protein